MVVRQARPEDAGKLAGLRWEFRSGIARAEEGREEFVERCFRWMRERLGDPEPRWRCWVAEHDGHIIGHVWLGFIEKLPNPADEPERHGYISNVFVREELRGQGLGERLLRAALEAARAADVDRVILWPTERSRTLYRRHGFAEPTDVLSLDLPPTER